MIGGSDTELRSSIDVGKMAEVALACGNCAPSIRNRRCLKLKFHPVVSLKCHTRKAFLKAPFRSMSSQLDDRFGSKAAVTTLSAARKLARPKRSHDEACRTRSAAPSSIEGLCDGLIWTWVADLEDMGDQADRWLEIPPDPHIAATMHPEWDSGRSGGVRDRPTVRSASCRQS
jgi:hypothetical protein